MLRTRLGARLRLASWPALQPGGCARCFTSYDQPFIRVSRHTKDDADLQRRDREKHPGVKRAVVFPGQGTQYVGMGADLAKEFPEARRVFEEVDEALGFRLSQIMWDGAQQELTMTENAQPAILAHSLAVFRVLQKELGLSAPRGYASMLGYSLGEWSAICASGALPLWDTARLVHYRGRVMQEAVPLGEGAMVALMPIDVPTASAIAKKAAEETGGLTCQIVLSGAAGAIDKAVEIAKREHKRIKLVQKLNVSAPFHCEMMRPAAQKLQDYMADSTNKAPPLACQVRRPVGAHRVQRHGATHHPGRRAVGPRGQAGDRRRPVARLHPPARLPGHRGRVFRRRDAACGGQAGLEGDRGRGEAVAVEGLRRLPGVGSGQDPQRLRAPDRHRAPGHERGHGARSDRLLQALPRIKLDLLCCGSWKDADGEDNVVYWVGRGREASNIDGSWLVG
ncbi:[Acyl-carrier protein] S-malonyltransferase [Acanthamoeba castellanii str. Neff]|uniref:[acyl-carrier-protein] S-malonyltransferase n=1 Tax=Acanthamoeba castellanii (strain ATCC 30010 / Neff) TaxID=1257118 RepID=L8GEV2_ACACF|nr:[Acyl-carrier protein] S-malonyltransferase [Acanthamoeba castellanii str. Neff]ELR11263.1 [Acyl-carrier protein] S-malonyltransferase [Acanthamoeba castellanii str. Neff]